MSVKLPTLHKGRKDKSLLCESIYDRVGLPLLMGRPMTYDYIFKSKFSKQALESKYRHQSDCFKSYQAHYLHKLPVCCSSHPFGYWLVIKFLIFFSKWDCSEVLRDTKQIPSIETEHYGCRERTKLSYKKSYLKCATQGRASWLHVLQ